MAKNNQTVFIANSLQDVLYHLKTVTGLQLIAGATKVNKLSDKSVALKNIPELTSYEKKERYIDIGAAVSLSDIIALGKENIPPVLYEAMESIGTEPIRNMATIGGNICSKGQKLTLWAPLSALEARIEYRNSKEMKLIPFSQFKGVPEGSVLTKIKIPIDDWEISIFKKVGPSNMLSEESASFVFLADTQKDILSSVRIAYAGVIDFRSIDLENRLIGNRLPLNKKIVSTFLDYADHIFNDKFRQEKLPPIVKAHFISLLRMSLQTLS